MVMGEARAYHGMLLANSLLKSYCKSLRARGTTNLYSVLPMFRTQLFKSTLFFLLEFVLVGRKFTLHPKHCQGNCFCDRWNDQ